MLRIIIALIIFAIADDACAKPEFKGRQTIKGLPRNVMRIHTKYSAIQSTKPRPKLRVDND